MDDLITLALPADLAPAATIRVIAGLYDWQTGARLPVSGTAAGPGDVVHLGDALP